jgi:transposase-like protein
VSLPTTLVEATRYFSDPDVCQKFIADMVWPNGIPTCPKCGSQANYYLKSRRVWTCKTCGKQFSVRNGTIMEDSHISLDKWLVAMWAICNDKNGISSWELHRAVGITQRSAWFLLHRIRLVMKSRNVGKLTGKIEADESYVGGLAENMHEYRRKAKIRGSGGVGKAIVMGLLQRHGEVRTEIIPDTRRPTVQARVRKHVEPGSDLFTDQLASYQGLAPEFAHQVINHAVAYAEGEVHTNGMENFWSLLKRCIRGTYVSVEPFHLTRYLDEQAYRFNTRKGTDADRFQQVVRQVTGKHLTYRQLTGNEDAA